MLALIDGGTGVASRPSLPIPSLSMPLLAIADTAIAARFQCWRGASGRRYTVSVFPYDADAPDRGLPDFDGCVVIPVRRHPAGHDGEARSAVGVVRIEGLSDARSLRAAGAAAGVGEWHVHLLAEDAASREAAAADLRRRIA